LSGGGVYGADAVEEVVDVRDVGVVSDVYDVMVMFILERIGRRFNTLYLRILGLRV
jgi:hypothetical protein